MRRDCAPGRSADAVTVSRTARGATARPPARLLRLHRRSLANLLVIGGSGAQRLAIARAFHAGSATGGTPFLHLDCARDEPFLWAALQHWLLHEDAYPGTTPLHGCDHGMLYLDSVQYLSSSTQRLLLVLARRLESGPASATATAGPLRLGAGNPVDLAEAVERQCFSGPLYDCLDKIRIGLDTGLRRGAA